MLKEKIPERVIERLAKYSRVLAEMDGDVSATISSEKLAEEAGFTASTIRKDLCCFGQFGTPKVGYNMEGLRGQISRILGTDKVWNAVLIGDRNLVPSVLTGKGSEKYGLRIKAVFDNDARKVEERWGSVKIQRLQELYQAIRSENVDVGIIALPLTIAQSVVDVLISAGVKAILNLVPGRVSIPDHVKLCNIDLPSELGKVSFFLNASEKRNLSTPIGAYSTGRR